MPADAKPSAYARSPVSRVPPNPCAMTTQGRPPGPRKASPVPTNRQAAQVTPLLVKVVSSMSAHPFQVAVGALRRLTRRGRGRLEPDDAVVHRVLDEHPGVAAEVHEHLPRL